MMGRLLEEFPPVATAAWEEAIAKDLKDTTDAEKLTWRSPEGISVKPYYRAEDTAGLAFAESAPGGFPYVRGTRPNGGWRIREHIHAIDPEEANAEARCAIAAGAEEIAFLNAAIANSSDLGILVANLGEIPLHFAHVTPAMVRLIADGDPKSPMPAFKGRLDEEEIEAVARYVQRLSRGRRKPISGDEVKRK